MISSQILLTLILVTAVGSQHSVCKSLQWVPGFRRKIFTAIMNHADCPTWSTRNGFTKETTEFTTLLLPKGMPFAFFCGACFSPGSLEVNLTAEMDNGQPLTFKPFKKNKHTLEHNKDDSTLCLISYGLTAPLSKGGQITCRFNRGKGIYEEKLSFNLKQTPIIEDEEEEESREVSNGIVRLQCPIVTGSNKNVNVWFSSENETPLADEVPFLVSSLNQEIDFRPKKKEYHISCVVYDVKNPFIVRRKRYKVVTPEEEIRLAQWSVEELEQDAQTGSGPSKIGIIYIIVGLLVGGISIASISVCVSFKKCKIKRKNTEKTMKEPQQEETNRLSLLHSHPYNKKLYQQ